MTDAMPPTTGSRTPMTDAMPPTTGGRTPMTDDHAADDRRQDAEDRRPCRRRLAAGHR